MNLRKKLVMYFTAALLALAYASSAMGQTPPSTVVTLNELLAPWLPLFIGAVATLLLALLTALTAYVKKRFNLEENKAFDLFEKNARDTLQSALTNAAGRVVLSLGERIQNVKLDVSLPEVRAAILQVNLGAAEAVTHFSISEQRLAEMIIDKVGVLTAPNPQVVPTAEPAKLPVPVL